MPRNLKGDDDDDDENRGGAAAAAADSIWQKVEWKILAAQLDPQTAAAVAAAVAR